MNERNGAGMLTYIPTSELYAHPDNPRKDLGDLTELAEADKEGRLVVLPCKPGDTVYSIFGAEVIEKTVGRVIINGYTTPRIWVDLDCSFLSSVTKRWDLGIGKDFFLTREEAEKALEVKQDD